MTARPQEPAPPIACTLDRDGLADRIDDWRALLTVAVGREDVPDGVQLTYPAGALLAGRIASLSAAEQKCCAFLDFTLHLTPAATVLTVRAPTAARPQLQDMFAAAGPPA